MMDDAPTLEVLLRLMESRTGLARHAEDQRATMTNFLVTISGVLVAFVAQQRFSPPTLVISILIVILGLFGVFASLKYAQHFHLHYSASKFYQQRLQLLSPSADIFNVSAQASERNMERYPFMRKRLSVVYLWLFLHGSICVIGVVCVVLNILVMTGILKFPII